MLTRSHSTRGLAAGLFAASLMPVVATADVPNPPDKSSSVTSALEAELQGNNETRDEILTRLLASPDNSPVRWQLGMIETDDDRWVDFRDVSATRAELLNEYRDVRAEFGTNPDELMRLADWCRDHDLSDAERAHLLQIIAQDADHAAARKRLGHFNLNGLWVTSEDFARAAARQAAIADSLKQWGQTIEESLALLSGVRRQRDRGHEMLFAIRELSAIPAMERVLAAGNEASGLLLIEWLSRLNAYQASQAIARTALVSSYDTVRRAAADSLRTRPYDEYMPVLLGALKTPVSVDSATYFNRQGWVVIDIIFEAEAQRERRRLVVTQHIGTTTVRRNIKPFNGLQVVRFDGLNMDLGDVRAIEDHIRATERRADFERLQWNALIRDTNRRAELVLRDVTSSLEITAPDGWWQWWDRFNEVHVSGVKPLLRVQPDPDRQYLNPQTKQVTDRPPLNVAMGSCLVAGTPVWTEQGPTPVEQVEIGDRVLAQNVNTGELAYQPVLATTVRPPVRTFVITTEDIQVRATGGHPFWVNGQAWKFARDLKPGMSLHGTDGSQPIQSVEPALEAEAFNLVVADFHTYFIGEGRILSHDNTGRQPTNSLVPGLSREP